jgi:hypothetical protein
VDFGKATTAAGEAMLRRLAATSSSRRVTERIDLKIALLGSTPG